MPEQRRVRLNYAKFFLSRKNVFAIGVPAVIELASVLVGPFLRHVMRCMHGAGGEVDKDRLVRSELLAVVDTADRLVHQVCSQVIPLLRCLRGLDLTVVTSEIGIVLAGVGAEESVVEIEAAFKGQRSKGPAALICSAGVRCHFRSAYVL